jgi:hypothetical protein
VTHRSVLIAQGRLPNSSKETTKPPIELKVLKNRRRGALAELALKGKREKEVANQVTHTLTSLEMPHNNDPF